jgi:hypothetical protein
MDGCWMGGGLGIDRVRFLECWGSQAYPNLRMEGGMNAVQVHALWTLPIGDCDTPCAGGTQ